MTGILKQESIWFAAYLKLKSNQRAKVQSPYKNSIDPVMKFKLLELRKAVLSNHFFWTEVKETMISKSDKLRKLKPLRSINDQLVQEVLQIILEPIYEFKFSQFSHGFRPSRNYHTALKWMNTNMKDSIWFIKGNIKSCISTIDHKILMKILERNIRDSKILKLIRSGLKAKVFQNEQISYIPVEISIPQGGRLSSLLLNIYFNEFDQFMVNLCEQYQGHVKLENRKQNITVTKFLGSKNKRLCYKLRIPNKISNEIGYRNCKYIRHADDFVIGVLGPRHIATEIKDKVKNFLQNKLHIELLLEKTKIIHISHGIEFLGYILSRKTFFVKQRYFGRLSIRKITIPILDVNMKKVIT